MKINKLQSLSLVAFIAIMILCQGCGPKKQILVPEGSQSPTLYTSSEAYNKLVGQYKDWKDMQMPIKVALKSPQEFSMSGRITMHRGKDIHISLRMLGMEVAAALVTPDSVFFVDRYHRMYLAEGISSLAGSYGVTMEDIQNIILGRGFFLGRGVLNQNSPINMTAQPILGNNIWQIIPEKLPSAFQYAFNVVLDNRQEPYVCILQIEPKGHTPIQVQYSDPVQTTIGEMASAASISTKVNDTGFIANIFLSADKATFNSGNPVNWNNPVGYKRIPASAIEDMFKDL